MKATGFNKFEAAHQSPEKTPGTRKRTKPGHRHKSEERRRKAHKLPFYLRGTSH